MSNFEIPIINTDTPDILTTYRNEQGQLGTIVTIIAKLSKIIKKYGKQRVKKKKVI